jgi:hypothetical protein
MDEVAQWELHPQISLGRSNQGELSRWGIWHTWERGENVQVLLRKPERERPLGGPWRRWEDGIKMDLRDIG